MRRGCGDHIRQTDSKTEIHLTRIVTSANEIEHSAKRIPESGFHQEKSDSVILFGQILSCQRLVADRLGILVD